jgi:hypothetical protein
VRQIAASPNASLTAPLNFQLQDSSLEFALQKTTALQQASLRVGLGMQPSLLQQFSALQHSLQLSATLQLMMQMQSGRPNPFALQILLRQKAILTGALSTPSPLQTNRQPIR